MHEINADETQVTINNDRERRHDPSLLSDHQHIPVTNVQDGTFSVDPTSQGDNDASLAASSQGHAELQNLPTEELMSSPPRLYVDPYNQSLPLLEGTLVQDLPNEPVYKAYRVSDTRNDDVPGWLRKNYKVVISGLVFVATALIITMVVVTRGGPKYSPIPPSTSSTDSTTETENLSNIVSEPQINRLYRMHIVRAETACGI